MYCFWDRLSFFFFFFTFNKHAHTHTHLQKEEASSWSLPVRKSMECVLRPAVSGDEAQMTPEHTDDRPHLTTADEPPTAQISPSNESNRNQTTKIFFCIFYFFLHFPFQYLSLPLMPVCQKNLCIVSVSEHIPCCKYNIHTSLFSPVPMYM